MASTKFQTLSQKASNQNGLQKMYIFNEGAFRKIRQEIDNEKYLSELDNELKKVLYNRKVPKYKKWLQYRELLNQYFNFRNFMNESQTNNDEISTRQLNLEQRIQELENQLKSTQYIQPQIVSTDVNDSAMDIDEPVQVNKSGNVTPNATINLDESTIRTNKLGKRNSTTPQQQSTPNKTERRRLSFGQNLNYDKSFVPLEETHFYDAALAGNEQIFGISSDESAEKSYTQAMDITERDTLPTYINLDESDDLMRAFDNDLIGKQTIRQRLDAAPGSVSSKFLINHQYPKRKFSITYYDREKAEDVQMEVDGLNVSIVKGDTLRISDHNSVTKVYNVRADSLDKIRNFLIDFHKKLDEAIAEDHQNRGEYISTKKYSIRDDDNDKNMKIIKFKNAIVKIPNEVENHAIELINSIVDSNMSNTEAEDTFK